MGKKNPYVFTIGFNKADPSHRMVVEILNEKGRGMAQYVTSAVLAYQEHEEKTKNKECNYQNIESIVTNILNQRLENLSVSLEGAQYSNKMETKKENCEQIAEKARLSNQDVKEIMNTLDFFREL